MFVSKASRSDTAPQWSRLLRMRRHARPRADRRLREDSLHVFGVLASAGRLRLDREPVAGGVAVDQSDVLGGDSRRAVRDVAERRGDGGDVADDGRLYGEL